MGCDQCLRGRGTFGRLGYFSLYIAVLVSAYRKIGSARRSAKGDGNHEWFVWALGATLFANTMAFISITYFDQSMIVWYAFLAMISAASILDAKPNWAWMAAQPVFESGLPSTDAGIGLFGTGPPPP